MANSTARHFVAEALERFVAGRPTGKIAVEIADRVWWERQAVLRWRNERLAELLTYCFDEIPFYRDRFLSAGLSRKELEEEGVLKRLPVLTRADARALRQSIDTKKLRGLEIVRTSGSTGHPVEVIRRSSEGAFVRAVQCRAYSWYGAHPFDDRMMLLAAPRVAATRLKHKLVDFLTGRHLREFAAVDTRTLRGTVEEIGRLRPKVLIGYPSVLHLLCLVAENESREKCLASVDLVHLQSEMLTEIQEQAIRRVFGNAGLLNEYGCVEVGAMAYTCPVGAMHVSWDHIVLEIAAEESEPQLERGSVLLTPLLFRTMPLIRYEVGDVASWSEDCTCGRFAGFPTLGRIEGRTFERLVLPDGRTLNGGIVHFLVRKANGLTAIDEYQLVQMSESDLVLTVVPSPRWDAGFPERFRCEAGTLLGGGVTIEVRVCDRIPRSGKKRRYFVSKV